MDSKLFDISAPGNEAGGSFLLHCCPGAVAIFVNFLNSSKLDSYLFCSSTLILDSIPAVSSVSSFLKRNQCGNGHALVRRRRGQDRAPVTFRSRLVSPLSFSFHSINQLPGESFGRLILTIGHSLRQPWQCAPQYYIYTYIDRYINALILVRSLLLERPLLCDELALTRSI